jgi:hypothetical protein
MGQVTCIRGRSRASGQDHQAYLQPSPFSAGFRNAYPALPYAQDRAGSLVPQADYVWRIILMFGTLPAALT